MPIPSVDGQPSVDNTRCSNSRNGSYRVIRPTASSGQRQALTPISRLPLWQRCLQHLLWVSAFVGTATIAAFGGVTLALSIPLPNNAVGQRIPQPLGFGDLWKSGFRYKVSRPVNILLMGIDEVPNVPETSDAIFSGRTDTLLLVRVDPKAHTAEVLSIPRDTRIRIPGYGMDKVNQANVEGGPELVAQTISDNFGGVPIHRYLRVSTGAFREIVDLIGGVEVFVPKRMVYEDHTQGLYIDLYPGWQTLTGDQAEQFARFRKDAKGDIGRVQRQQMLLKALRQQLGHPRVIPKLPEIVRILERYVDTNLSLEEMLALAGFGLGLEPDNLHMVMLPGRFSQADEYVASYWIPDWNSSSQIMQDFFQVEGMATLAGARESQSTLGLRIAVQNASEDDHTAREVARYLRDQGFYNAYVTTDWPMTQRRTEVIAQRGDLDSARILESVLGIGQVVADSTGDLESDITLRVGEDWLDLRTADDPGTESFVN